MNIIGAHPSLLRFENVRIMKDMRNSVNRIVNCETANLNKTIQAAIRQVENIRLIEREMGLEHLNEKFLKSQSYVYNIRRRALLSWESCYRVER